MGCKPKRQFAGDIFDSCRPVIFNLYNLDSISITGGAFYLAVEKGGPVGIIYAAQPFPLYLSVYISCAAFIGIFAILFVFRFHKGLGKDQYSVPGF